MAEENLEDAERHAARMLAPDQQPQLERLSELLTAAIQARRAGDDPQVRVWFEQALAKAQELADL